MTLGAVQQCILVGREHPADFDTSCCVIFPSPLTPFRPFMGETDVCLLQYCCLCSPRYHPNHAPPCLSLCFLQNLNKGKWNNCQSEHPVSPRRRRQRSVQGPRQRGIRFIRGNLHFSWGLLLWRFSFGLGVISDGTYSTCAKACVVVVFRVGDAKYRCQVPGGDA